MMFFRLRITCGRVVCDDRLVVAVTFESDVWLGLRNFNLLPAHLHKFAHGTYRFARQVKMPRGKDGRREKTSALSHAEGVGVTNILFSFINAQYIQKSHAAEITQRITERA